MSTLITFIIFSLFFSFMCSAMEAALLSITPSFIAGLQDQHPHASATLRKLKLNINHPLAAILTLNTVANTVGAAGVGALAQESYGSIGFTVLSVVLTLLILFVGEILPKTLGAVYWRALAVPVARVLPVFIFLLYPIVVVAEKVTGSIKGKQSESGVLRDEFAALAKLGMQQGIFSASESRVLLNLFRLAEMTAHDVMTPRTVLFSLDEATTVREAVAEQSIATFSRIPIWRDSVDHVTGYVLKNQLLLEAAQGNPDKQLKELAREVLIVPSSLSLPHLLEKLLNESEHFGLVVDEYGGIDGVVTMEDVLETLLGMEIVDEKDSVHNMRAMARERWNVRARSLGTIPPPAPEKQDTT